MEREVGGGIGMGNTCKPMAVSFQCMTKFTTNKKKEREKKKKGKLYWVWECPVFRWKELKTLFTGEILTQL